MTADASELEAVGRRLQSAADDLYHLGRVVTDRAGGVMWQCAKADRFRTAMDARTAEVNRLAAELRELGLAVRARAALLAAESSTRT